MIWETYRNEFNRNKLKLSETVTVIPRVDLTEQTAPAPGTLRLPMSVSSPGPEACEFQSNISFKTERYVLKPFCVYSRLLLRCFIDHNISFGNHITLNLIETRREETYTSKPAGSPSRYVRGGRKWLKTPDRLQVVQNVLASVVDIGAKTDYDATETRMLKSIMAPETKKTTCRRKASGVLN